LIYVLQDRPLNQLFPDVYAAADTESLLYKLLDAVGAEFMVADEAIKRLLKSHWVDYAEGAALDGLAATFGVTRRRLRGGELESDDGFRQRLKSIVPLFAGGGTRRAVIGAVRSALGLPFDLDQLNLPDSFAGLRRDIENLITLEEFSPKGERVLGRDVVEVLVDDQPVSEVTIPIDIPTVREERPTIHWSFTQGGARQLALLVTPDVPDAEATGIKSVEALVIPPGETLVLTALENGRLSAALGFTELAGQFTNLDGSTPAVLPQVPLGRSQWRFRARSGIFDISLFDDINTFDLPVFEVEMSWLRYEPLTFDVHVPYFLKEAVADLRAFHNYPGNLFVFEGLPVEALVDVVDQTRAAGVRGSVQFSLNFLDVHNQHEAFTLAGQHTVAEPLDMREALTATSVNDIHERHDMNETFTIGGVWDISPFDQGHGFEE
jgi:hypothetical protein